MRETSVLRSTCVITLRNRHFGKCNKLSFLVPHIAVLVGVFRRLSARFISGSVTDASERAVWQLQKYGNAD